MVFLACNLLSCPCFFALEWKNVLVVRNHSDNLNFPVVGSSEIGGFFFPFSSQLLVDWFEKTSLPSVISSLQQSKLPMKSWYSTSRTRLHELQQKPRAQKPIQPYTPAGISEDCQQGTKPGPYHIPRVVCKHLELGQSRVWACLKWPLPSSWMHKPRVTSHKWGFQ